MFDVKKSRIIRVIGHKNPDTDSICAAISYAYLKNQLSDEPYEPRRAGEISRETEYVLQHFDAPVPRLSVSMSPDIGNVDVRPEPGINENMSLLSAWRRMMDRNVYTLCVVDENNDLKGLITVTDIAEANMDLLDTEVLGKAHTSVKNLVETLEGKVLVGDPEGVITEGRLHIGTSPEVMADLVREGDVVIVTNRYEAQMCAIDYGTKYLIVCADSTVPEKLKERAADNGCTIICTHYDTYAASRLITMSAPVSYFMISGDKLLAFNIRTPVDEAERVMAKLRHRYFPVLDREGHYAGMVSRRNMLSVHRKKLILVDHNEASQAIDGYDKANILEIIDHHRIGTLETGGPVYFRNVPVGCTCTIIYTMYRENNIEIPKQMAGLMMSAILSDTLLFHSPTCTPTDKKAVEELAKIAGEDVEEYARHMFEAGENLEGRDVEDIVHQDYKEFLIGDTNIAVGQGFFMSEKAYDDARDMICDYLPSALAGSGVNMIFYMLTSIPTQSTLLICTGDGADEIVGKAFNVEMKDHCGYLEGVVSRKKQLIPALREVILNS